MIACNIYYLDEAKISNQKSQISDNHTKLQKQEFLILYITMYGLDLERT